MKRDFFKTLGSTLIVAVFVLLAFGSSDTVSTTSSSSSKDNSTETNKKVHCKRCYEDLTDEVNRIYNYGDYYCTPCWKAVKRDIKQQLEAEGY